ncbi:MAG TPA: hypothetical protein VID24_06595 [Candidatus Eremiobacteraceae bacterium]|jgi:hypothetical protein
MADAATHPQSRDDLPAALSYPLSINIRNSDLGIDESGHASRLSETAMLATIRSSVNPGTVFFTAIDMKALNATARGLIRVVSQRPLEDGIGVETLFDFIELSDDAKQKIQRLLTGGPAAATLPPPSGRNFATDQLAVQPVYQRGDLGRMDVGVSTTERTYFEPAPLRQQAHATRSTKFWNSLGVTAYVIAFLVVVAFFPAGRKLELAVWNTVAWGVSRTWYWANHVGDVKLYNNT